MGQASKVDFDNPAPVDEEEDEETLAAIDEGIRYAEAGRTVPMEEVRRRLPRWITASSSRKVRSRTATPTGRVDCHALSPPSAESVRPAPYIRSSITAAASAL
jgi:hypothetical protein